MTTANNNNIPGPAAPLLDSTGRLNQVWFQFFISLFNRTGANIGVSSQVLQTAIAALQQANIVTNAQISDLFKEENKGDQQVDIASLIGLIYAVEAIASQALSNSSQLITKISELESRIESLGAPAPVPAGFDSLTIGTNLRTVAYY